MKLNELLGIEFPIIQGGMANIATGAFAAAVSNAGALGLVASGGMDAEALRAEIRAAKANAGKPFGVNLMLMSPYADDIAQIILEEGVKDTYNFGPILIKDGQAQPAWSETAKYYPRTAVGMVKPGIYVLLVTDTGSYAGLNHWDLVNIFNSYGCQYAYNLDGGGSATLYYNGQVMNKLINNYERPCGDFLYFTN